MRKIILLILILIFVCVNTLLAQNADNNTNIFGTYSFLHSTDIIYEVIHIDNGDGTISLQQGKPLNDDGCCTQKASLELKENFTFALSYVSDQGCYKIHSQSQGICSIKGDTLTLFCPMSITKQSAQQKSKLSKSLLQLTFKNKIWKNIDDFEFYSLDKNFNKTKINLKYTIPDLATINKIRKNYNYYGSEGIEYKDTTSLSFVFDRKNIDAYFLVKCRSGNFYYDEQNGGCLGGVDAWFIKMIDFKHNNNYLMDDNSHLNDFSFLINKGNLTSITQCADEQGKKFHYEFIKK